MLDKSIPYYNVIMRRPSGIPIPSFELPHGYSIVSFREGQEEKWAEIEASVGEFETKEEALRYFHAEYMPFTDDLKERSLFVVNANREEAGTVTGWWNRTGMRRDPSIHWFAVKQDYQGLGLGKALVSECLKRLVQLEGNKDVFLHTQTWSYRAIGLYMKAGFRIEPSDTFAYYRNEYREAMPILRKYLKNI
ncbi:GNAT family N-acetyltransferase [Paenibacillus sp. P25]|nr:GNAT family N-acetyltransferase [Paenibacillus sp. P25]